MSEEKTEAEKQSEKLTKLLKTAGKFDETLQKLRAIEDNNEKVLFIENLLKENNLMLNFEDWKEKKDPAKSDLYRNEGNKSYREKKFLRALAYYNKSLCFAPPGSGNMGNAYANRSAAYLAMEHYEKALENIELARNHNYPKEQLEKLKDREEKCLELMNNKPQKNDFQENERYRDKLFKEHMLPANKRAPCYIADCLELKSSPEFGRHIVTNKDLEVGTVIIIEEPFTASWIYGARYHRCANCLKRNMINLLPCDSCCSTMFCSEECKKIGQDKFHQYDCGFNNVYGQLDSQDCLFSALKTFFEALSIFNSNPEALMDFLQEIDESNVTAFDIDFSNLSELETRKYLLRSVLSLNSHESTRNDWGLITHSTNSAIVTKLMLDHTKLGAMLNDQTRAMFRKFIFKLYQIAAHNLAGIHFILRFWTSNGHETIKPIEFGCGTFPFCSFLNHSCVSNVSRLNDGLKNCMIVTAPIKAGEQVFDDYGFHHTDVAIEKRQEYLQKYFKFSCQCVACLSPEKYKIFEMLDIKDKKVLSNEDPYLLAGKDFGEAFKRLERFCRYIQMKYATNYPCQEISVMRDKILRIVLIFLMNEMY